MEFTVIPKSDLGEIFSPEEISEMRHSVDGWKYHGYSESDKPFFKHNDFQEQCLVDAFCKQEFQRFVDTRRTDWQDSRF